MSLQPTIDAIQHQLAQRDAKIAVIEETYADNELARLVALKEFYVAEIELRRRLRECTRSEIKWLRAQTVALRQRRFEREIMRESEAVGVQRTLKQRLAAKLAERNTGRAVE
jgi:hypothetical protein